MAAPTAHAPRCRRGRRAFQPERWCLGIQQLAFRRTDQSVDLGLIRRLGLEATLADLDQIIEWGAHPHRL